MTQLLVRHHLTVFQQQRRPGAVTAPPRDVGACLGQLQRATASGVPIDGYFQWSAQDNLEWNAGFGNRFGMIYVDFGTRERTPKLSAEWFREAARITIDLQGFAITGDRTVFTIGIWVPGFDGVTVKNGVVRNFYDGVIASGAEKFTLSNVTAAGNVFTGFSVNNSTKASLSNVTGFGSAYGIYVIGNGAKITSASAIGNTNLGIAIEGDGVSIKSSSAVGNAYGIIIFGVVSETQTPTKTSVKTRRARRAALGSASGRDCRGARGRSALQRAGSGAISRSAPSGRGSRSSGKAT
jgi:Glycosyl hydrolase family 1